MSKKEKTQCDIKILNKMLYEYYRYKEYKIYSELLIGLTKDIVLLRSSNSKCLNYTLQGLLYY